MRIAIVVQRYGNDINGGAELHARWIAEHLGPKHDLTVLTTTAQDYLQWKNHYPPGPAMVGEIPVIRFPVKRQRRGHRFIFLQNRVFYEPHDRAEEEAWVAENGPYAPDLIRYLARHEKDFDFVIFFSYRYYTTYQGVKAVPGKAILVPTAEEDPAIQLGIFKEFFCLPAAFIYNSHEEKAMINRLSGNQAVLNDVVGVGINLLPGDEARFRQKYELRRPYVLYVGRIDKNKGCDRLFDYMLRFFERVEADFDLVLLGGHYLAIPKHERIRALGFVSEQDKFDALAGAQFMVIPSPFESLCMALLESWAFGKPALVNGRCKVLLGQVQRANGGLYYTTYSEFQEAMKRLLTDGDVRRITGQQGLRHFNQTYAWPVVLAKYESIFEQLLGRRSS